MGLLMGPAIDGSTRLLAVLGDPIAQVGAPAAWTGLFARQGINAVGVPLHVSADALPAMFNGLRELRNLVGLIVTIPHKPAMLDLVDEASARARQVGAVNVVVFRADGAAVGDILDGVGFVNGLHARGQSLDGRRALVVGAGGVGSAIAFALADAGVQAVRVNDALPERAARLAARLRAANVDARAAGPDPAGFDLVVNASPMGMRPDDPLPVDCARLDPSAVVADVVLHATLTPFLVAARQRGCYVQPGTHMMNYQIAHMAAFFGLPDGDWSPEGVSTR